MQDFTNLVSGNIEQGERSTANFSFIIFSMFLFCVKLGVMNNYASDEKRPMNCKELYAESVAAKGNINQINLPDWPL